MRAEEGIGNRGLMVYDTGGDCGERIKGIKF